ncbi:MAG TPA: hypothetical protein VN836_03530 [Verrucomicrobiae bacterium]|nr:hypothetical protein [Verrucomicrobiae bacterium]
MSESSRADASSAANIARFYHDLPVSGPQGPDYTLLTTTNLTGGWQALYTISSTNSPVTEMTETNTSDPARFYRIELGP